MQMSGYSGQEPTIEYQPARAPETRILEFDAFQELRRKVRENPNPEGVFGQFALTAVQEGWKIGIDRTGGLVAGYDNIISAMWQDLYSDMSTINALGKITAHSFGYVLSDDGR